MPACAGAASARFGRPDGRRERRAGPAERLLHRRQQRRRLEDHRLSAASGSRSSTISRPARSARSRSPRRIPNVIYVGSGEGLQRPDLSTGDGIYKSTDGGKTWKTPGPARRPADSGHHRRSEGPESRVRRRARSSVWRRTRSAASSARSTAAQTWEKVLYKDENTGAMALAFDPS